MASEPDRTFLTLHGLRLKGFADTGALAACARLGQDEVDAELTALAEQQLVLRRDGRVSGWTLTPAGKQEHARRLEAELEACGGRERIEGCYRRFLEVNGELLAVCTAWQVREDKGGQELNDHSDPDYDRAVIDRLAGIDQAVQPVVAELGDCLDRFRPYGARLGDALARVQAGEHEWFTKPTCDSYHTVWFELHEDLLATLGIERGSEQAG